MGFTRFVLSCVTDSMELRRVSRAVVLNIIRTHASQQRLSWLLSSVSGRVHLRIESQQIIIVRASSTRLHAFVVYPNSFTVIGFSLSELDDEGDTSDLRVHHGGG